MNRFKKLATLCIALLLGVGAAAFAGCGGNKTSESASVETNSTSSGSASASDNEQTAEAYVFTVLNADGTPANVAIKLCEMTTGICYMPVNTDENGVVVYDKVPDKGVYEIQILAIDEEGNLAMDEEFNNIVLEFEGEANTPDEYGAITLKLKA